MNVPVSQVAVTSVWMAAKSAMTRGAALGLAAGLSLAFVGSAAASAPGLSMGVMSGSRGPRNG
jgi:hypothetical protein